MTERIGIYPGTFDPITLGHADIIRRGSKLVDRLIIGVTTNPAKTENAPGPKAWRASWNR